MSEWIGRDPLPNPLPEGRGSQAEPLAGPSPLSLQGEGWGEGAQQNRKGGVNRKAGRRVKRHAKSLRKGMTEVEKILWYHLRAQRFEHFKFRRQHPLGNYVADFVCLKEKLIIELDGGQHAGQQAYDAGRARYFEEQGFRILRFWNNEMIESKEAVLETILSHLTGLVPSPFRERARERVTL